MLECTMYLNIVIFCLAAISAKFGGFSIAQPHGLGQSRKYRKLASGWRCALPLYSEDHLQCPDIS
jgi:hypothetical protein